MFFIWKENSYVNWKHTFKTGYLVSHWVVPSLRFFWFDIWVLKKIQKISSLRRLWPVYCVSIYFCNFNGIIFVLMTVLYTILVNDNFSIQKYDENFRYQSVITMVWSE